MLVGILKIIFGKVVGLDKIPAEKREKFWEKLGEYSVKLAGEMAEGATRGAVEGAKNGNGTF